MKKLFAIIIALSMILLFASCSVDSELSTEESTDSLVESSQESYVLEDPIMETPDEIPQGTTETTSSGESLKVTQNGKIICIDAGHQHAGISETEPNGPGSSMMKAKLTTGTSGCATGRAEYQVNLEVALKLQKELQSRGYQVVMIRTTNDCPKSNAERAQIANESGANLFIRIHCNSVTDSSVKGIINYAPSAGNPYLSSDVINSSIRFAQLLADNMCAVTGAQNRGVIQDNTMTGINWSQIPVAIVEMGFMSNPEEDQLLSDATYQSKLATGMANGIDAYFK